MLSQTRTDKPILVFLPNGAAHVIVKKLAEHGYQAMAVSTVPALFDALRSDGYSLAITNRPDIDIVRNIQSIPVINLEVFFYAEPTNGGFFATSKRFNGTAFIERVSMLADPTAGAKFEALSDCVIHPPRRNKSQAHRFWAVIKSRFASPRVRSAKD